MKYNLGVTDIIFELCGFKFKISAILERHRCHSKDSCVASVNKFPFDVVLHNYDTLCCSSRNNSPKTPI